MSVLPKPPLAHSQSHSTRALKGRAMRATPDSSPELGTGAAGGGICRNPRAGLTHSASYSGAGAPVRNDGRPDVLEYLPATTYSPPSPRGRLVTHPPAAAVCAAAAAAGGAPPPPGYVRPSLRLDPHMMPSTDEILAATRGRRSGSQSSATSASSVETAGSSRSEKRQGRLFLPASGGLLDLLMENREMEEE